MQPLLCDPGGTRDGQPVHASCVALGARGLLLLGASGSGKSGLALVLMAFGARLVADDRTLLTLRNGGLWATCPAPIRGKIEARGMGILAAEPQEGAWIAAAVDLDRNETERLPPPRSQVIQDNNIPLFLNGPGLHFAAGLIQYLKGERLT